MEKFPSDAVSMIKQHYSLLLQFQGFEEFLKTSFFMTTQMQAVESLNSKIGDDEEYIDAHNTSILDDSFFSKFTDTSN